MNWSAHCKKHGEMVVISGADSERHCIFLVTVAKMLQISLSAPDITTMFFTVRGS